MAVEVFTNLASTTVSSGGTTAPAAGTVESWTVASSAGFPVLAAGQQFRIVEDDVVRQSEIILVTAISGTTWTVTRGAEGSAPVAHPAGFTIVQSITAAVLAQFVGLDGAQTITGQKTFASAANQTQIKFGVRGAITAVPVVGAYGASVVMYSGLEFDGTNLINRDTAAGLVFGSVTNATSGLDEFQVYTSTAGAVGAVATISKRLAVTASGTAVTGTLSSTGNLSENGNRVFSAGNLPTAAQVTSGTFPGNYVFTGNVTIGNKALWAGTRTMPGSTNTVDLGTFTSTQGAFQVNLMLTMNAAGFAVTKSYEIDVTGSVGTASTWYKVLPQDSSQNSGAATDFTLEVNRNATTNAYSFRIRQVGATGGTLTFQAEGYGDASLTFTTSTATTAAPAAVTAVWSPTPLYTGPGRVGINNDSPAVELDVTGGLNTTGPAVFGASAGPTIGVYANGAATGARVFGIQSGGSTRWVWGATAGAETGSNAGSDWRLWSYADDGVTLIGALIQVTRATGAVTIPGPTSLSYDSPNTGTTGAGGLLVGTRVALASVVNSGAFLLDNFYYNGSQYIARTTAASGGGGLTFSPTTGLGYVATTASVTAGTAYPLTTVFSVSPVGATVVAGTLNVAGAVSINNTVSLTAANNGLEVGAVGTANTPFIDFHSGATGVDYDSRLLASGGTGVSGGGTLAVYAASFSTTSNATFGDGTAAVAATINGPVSTARELVLSTAGSRRWSLRANNTAEVGSNVGSDFAIRSYDDTGTVLTGGAPFTITRANGTTLLAALSSNSVLSVTYNGATADNSGYGIIGVTAPSTVNTAYYSMTEAGTGAYGIGIGADHIMRVGAITAGKVMSGTAVRIDTGGNITITNPATSTTTGYYVYDNATALIGGFGLRAAIQAYHGIELRGGRVTAAVAPATGGAGADPSVTVYHANTTHVGLKVKGVASQTGDYLQAENSAGVVQARIDSNGAAFATAFSAVSTTAATGGVRLWPGGIGNTGYIDFTQPNATRAGYIGFGAGAGTTTDGGTITYNASNHTFTSTGGATTTITLSADSTGGRGAEIGFADTKAGQATPNKYIRSQGGQLQFVNSAYNAVIASLSDAGVFSANNVSTSGISTYDTSLVDTTTPGTVAGSSQLYSVSGRPKVKDGLGNIWNLDSSQLVRVGAALNATSSTLGTTGITWSGLSAGTYAFEVFGTYQTQTTGTGLQLAVAFSGTQTAMNAGAVFHTSQIGVNGDSTTSLASKLGAATTGPGASSRPFILTGTIVVTAAGNLDIQYASGAAGNQVTVDVGTFGRLTRIA